MLTPPLDPWGYDVTDPCEDRRRDEEIDGRTLAVALLILLVGSLVVIKGVSCLVGHFAK